MPFDDKKNGIKISCKRPFTSKVALRKLSGQYWLWTERGLYQCCCTMGLLYCSIDVLVRRRGCVVLVLLYGWD
jgi:hypothetical protein